MQDPCVRGHSKTTPVLSTTAPTAVPLGAAITILCRWEGREGRGEMGGGRGKGGIKGGREGGRGEERREGWGEGGSSRERRGMRWVGMAVMERD